MSWPGIPYLGWTVAQIFTIMIMTWSQPWMLRWIWLRVLFWPWFQSQSKALLFSLGVGSRSKGEDPRQICIENPLWPCKIALFRSGYGSRDVNGVEFWPGPLWPRTMTCTRSIIYGIFVDSAWIHNLGLRGTLLDGHMDWILAEGKKKMPNRMSQPLI